MFLEEIQKNDSLDLNGYIKLYSNGINIHDIKPLSNESFNLFLKSNVDIRLVSIKENYNLLSNLNKIHYFVNTVRKNDLLRSKKFNINIKDSYFYMIPIQTMKGTIVGFICRLICKNFISKNGIKYFSIFNKFKDYTKQVPYMFGFYKDFDDYDNYKECKPIIVCEGIKDCIYLKQFYPYVLSNNTSNLGFSTQVLRNITNKILIVYDNDKIGRPSSIEDSNKLQKLGYICNILELDKNIKDPATYIKYPELERRFVSRLKSSLKMLEGI